MRIYDIIQKKRDGLVLSDEEIAFAVNGFTGGDVPDYQMSALLMAIFINGMDKSELAALTLTMTRSGDSVDLSMFGTLTADKHSTGGVGDKTTLIVAPIVAALGGKVAKMSGRGLGHTGGTVDKLESIPGYQTTMTREAFIKQVHDVGVAVIGQTGHIAPADKKIYALRDVTATVDSIPLIASSIMSKKLAAGSKNIVLDVKTGSGAFMKSAADARRLGETMVEIGRAAGRNMTAVITNMDIPLGSAVGNALEILEAAEALSGHGSHDLVSVSTELAARMLCLCRGWSYEESVGEVSRVLSDGTALNQFRQWITAQGGDAAFIDDPAQLGTASIRYPYTCNNAGYINHMDAERIGKAASALGAGRIKSGDEIDRLAGIVFHKKTGDAVSPGETLAVLHTSDKRRLTDAEAYLDDAITITETCPSPEPLIYGIIN